MNNGDGFHEAPNPADPKSVGRPRCDRGSWFTWSDDGERVLHPKGDLVLADPLDRFLKSVELQPGERLVLDFFDVHSIGSEALGRLILRRLDADLLEILHVTRLDSFFEIGP